MISVLVLEDEPDIAEIYKTKLEKEYENLEIELTETGEEALENVKHRIESHREQPEVILSDRRIVGGESGDWFLNQLEDYNDFDRDKSYLIVMSSVYRKRDDDLEESLYDEYIQKSGKKDMVEVVREQLSP